MLKYGRMVKPRG